MKTNFCLGLISVFLSFLFVNLDSVFAAVPFPQGNADASACAYNYNTIRYVDSNTTPHRPDPNYDWAHCTTRGGISTPRTIWLPDNAEEVTLFQTFALNYATPFTLTIRETVGSTLKYNQLLQGRVITTPAQIILRKSTFPALGQARLLIEATGTGDFGVPAQIGFVIKKTPTPTPPPPLALPGTFTLIGTAECSGNSPRNNLSWTASSGATSYQVFRNGTLLTTTTSRTYSDTQITSGSQNTYTVTARNTGGTRSAQASVRARSDCQTPPSTNITLNVTTSCNGTLPQNNLNWTVSGSGPFELTRSPNFLTGTRTITSSPNTFADTGVTPGVLYSYTIRSTSSNSQVSNSVTARTDCNRLTPFTVSATSACVGQQPQNNLTWTSSQGATSYRIFRNSTANLLRTQTGTSFTDTTPAAETPYTYIVQAVDSSGAIVSASTFVTTTRCTPIVTCTPENTVTWQSVSSASATYDVYRDGSPIATRLTGTTYVDKDLTAGQVVTYTVRSRIGSRLSPPSNAIRITSHSCIPPFDYTFTVQPSLLLVNRGGSGVLTAIARDNRGNDLFASGSTPINWSISTTTPGDISPKGTTTNKTTTFTATTSCELLRQASTAIVSATVTIQGITKTAQATVNVQDVCSAEVIGDIFAEGSVANLTVDDRSIIAAGQSIIDIDGRAVQLSDYDIGEGWEEFKQAQIEITNNLINERARRLSAGDYRLGSQFNLNPDGASNPEGGVFYVPGNLIIDQDVTFTGKGTIIVGGRVILSGGARRISYQNPNTDIVGIIALEGDLNIPTSSQIVGSYFIADGSIIVNGTEPSVSTKASGLFVGDKITLNGQNTTIIYDGRIVTNPPLGFAEHFVPTINEARP